jgi:hypothetical protein
MRYNDRNSIAPFCPLTIDSPPGLLSALQAIPSCLIEGLIKKLTIKGAKNPSIMHIILA